MKAQNKTVLITGGAKRIGKAIATKFFNSGYKLKIHYNSSKDDAMILAEKFNAEIFNANFADCENTALYEMVENCSVLINNASLYLTDLIPDYKINTKNDEIQMQVNYHIPIKLMKYFNEVNNFNNMSIINILDAKVVKKNTVKDSYTASKYALYKATKEYAKELAPKIRVNGIAPGTILPPPWLSDGKMQKSIKQMLLSLPPSVEDIASSCLFLAETYGITGEVIKVDSGQNIQ